VNLRTKRAWNTTLLAAAFCLTAFRADAQHATVNLPVEAHWGSAVLQPGEYRLDVPAAQSWPQHLSLTQNGRVVWISSIAEGSGRESDRSYLRLVTVGGTYFVREYSSGPTGKQFTFWIPKATQPEPSVKAQATTLPLGKPTE
jgi:hypothetical protein